MEHQAVAQEVNGHKPVKTPASGSADDISSQYEIPSLQVFTSFSALKDRIRHHYELCSDYYYSLW